MRSRRSAARGKKLRQDDAAELVEGNAVAEEERLVRRHCLDDGLRYSLTVAGGVRWPAGRTLDMSAHDVGQVRRHVQHDENRDIVEMRRQSAEEEAQRLRPAGRCADGENARDGNRPAHLDRRRPGRVRPGIP